MTAPVRAQPEAAAMGDAAGLAAPTRFRVSMWH